MWWMISVLLLSRFSLSLVYDSLIVMYLDMDLFGFILLRMCWASWVSRIWRHFRPLFTPNFVVVVFFPFGTSIMHTLVHLMVFYRCLKLCSCFFITFFFSFFSLDWRISIDICSSFLVLHSASLNLQSCSFSKTFHFSCCTKFFFFFSHTTWLVESQFPTRDWAWTAAMKVLSPNQWTTREFLWSSFFILGFIFMWVLFL